jgi:predicted Zn-dependent protease with MMP-like domain
MISVSEEEFQHYMEKALGLIPEAFRDKMDNIVFIIEPYPSESDLVRLGLNDRRQLLGLYSGIPYTRRDTGYMGAMPDRIILFQKNIESVCRTEEQLIDKIREVVIHEIAHYFGMDDEEIRNAGF